MHNPIVLVVDDEPTNRAFVRRALSSAGWSVIEAADGDEAVAAVNAALPNLVVMDINMPQRNGWEATRLIRAAPPPHGMVPILAFTSLGLTDDMVRTRGMDGWIPKPCPDDVLIQAAARWRPDGQMAQAERLAVAFGADEIAALVRSFRDQLADAIDRLDGSDQSFLAHRIAGVAGTLGFTEVSSSWLRLSEGDASALDEARRDARLVIFEIDRKMTGGDAPESGPPDPSGT